MDDTLKRVGAAPAGVTVIRSQASMTFVRGPPTSGVSRGWTGRAPAHPLILILQKYIVLFIYLF